MTRFSAGNNQTTGGPNAQEDCTGHTIRHLSGRRGHRNRLRAFGDQGARAGCATRALPPGHCLLL